jgi:hypothetical protein
MNSCVFAANVALAISVRDQRPTVRVDSSQRVKCSIPNENKISYSESFREQAGYRERGFSSHFVRRRILAVVVGDDDSFSTDTSVALIMAKTASPFLRFIRLTEPVVMIEVTGPAAVLITISETTLSDTICSIVPGK